MSSIRAAAGLRPGGVVQCRLTLSNQKTRTSNILMEKISFFYYIFFMEHTKIFENFFLPPGHRTASTSSNAWTLSRRRTLSRRTPAFFIKKDTAPPGLCPGGGLLRYADQSRTAGTKSWRGPGDSTLIHPSAQRSSGWTSSFFIKKAEKSRRMHPPGVCPGGCIRFAGRRIISLFIPNILKGYKKNFFKYLFVSNVVTLNFLKLL
jgi:hypothetical protein